MDLPAPGGDLHAGGDRHGALRQRATTAVVMGLFASGMAVCILLITAHDRPFIRQVPPIALLQVQPDAAVESTGR